MSAAQTDVGRAADAAIVAALLQSPTLIEIGDFRIEILSYRNVPLRVF